MKRLSILLVIPVLLLSFSFIVPASAAETDGNYFNVLDYTGINNTPLTNVTFSGSTQLHFDLTNTYGSFNAYSVEFTYSYSGSTPSLGSFTLDRGAASTVKTDYIGNGIYRYRASFLGRAGSYFDIGLTSSGETSINVLAFNVYLTGSELFPLSGTVITSTVNYFSGGESSYIGFSNSGSVHLQIDYWRNYDSLLFYLAMSASPIESISAVMISNVDGSETPLNLNISPTYSTVGNDNYLISLDVDLTSIDRVSVPDSTLHLYLTFQSVSSGSVTIRSAYGSVFSDPPDPLTKWHQILFFNVGNWFQSLENTVFNGFESIEAKIDEVFGVSEFQQKETEVKQSVSDFDSAFNQENDYISGLLFPEYIDIVIEQFSGIPLDGMPIFTAIMSYLWDVPYIVLYITALSLFLVFSALLFGRRG